jgi:hypothetical protein
MSTRPARPSAGPVRHVCKACSDTHGQQISYHLGLIPRRKDFDGILTILPRKEPDNGPVDDFDMVEIRASFCLKRSVVLSVDTDDPVVVVSVLGQDRLHKILENGNY